MNYEPAWRVLEALVLDLKKKHVIVLPDLIDDLKSAQTLINIYKTDPTALEVVTQIETYFETLESNLLYLAGSDVGEDYANAWLRRLYEARMQGGRETPPGRSRFVSGVPKGEYWIRIQLSDLIRDEEVDTLLAQRGLISEAQANGYRLIYGKKENVTAFIKEVSEKLRRQKPPTSK
ncbi:hypothetical protein AC480_05300 [miscellaneous Crenarchaeota group archaeon SMTZ1-55]|nr:MAG: hypothetical protein AC480_05300 [miscellaneous Crenarchaeota group archaeon SMTZ1-55]